MRGKRVLKIKLLKKQREFVFSKNKYTAYIGGIGSGKTTAGAVKSILYALKYPMSIGLVVAPTYPMLRDVVIEKIFELCPAEVIESYSRTDKILSFINGSKILFRSLDRPDRIRGINADWGWLDEAAYVNRNAWSVFIGRIRGTRSNRHIFITTTPKGINWVYQQFESDESKLPDSKIIHATTFDNIFLPQDYIESLRQRYSAEFFEQELLAKFIRFKGLIYKEFDDKLHIVDPKYIPKFIEFDEFIAGVDWGYTVPSAILVVGIKNGNYYVVDEFYEKNIIIDELIDTAKSFQKFYNISAFYCDPSQPMFIEKLNAEGLYAEPGNNKVLAGISVLKGLFSENRILISSKCYNLIEELKIYSWEEKNGEYIDEPRKENDHAADALRYAIITHGYEEDVESIKVGDYIM